MERSNIAHAAEAAIRSFTRVGLKTALDLCMVSKLAIHIAGLVAAIFACVCTSDSPCFTLVYDVFLIHTDIICICSTWTDQ